MTVKRNYFLYCLLESIAFQLTSHWARDYDSLPNSGGNCLLENLYSLKATQKSD